MIDYLFLIGNIVGFIISITIIFKETFDYREKVFLDRITVILVPIGVFVYVFIGFKNHSWSNPNTNVGLYLLGMTLMFYIFGIIGCKLGSLLREKPGGNKFLIFPLYFPTFLCNLYLYEILKLIFK